MAAAFPGEAERVGALLATPMTPAALAAYAWRTWRMKGLAWSLRNLWLLVSSPRAFLDERFEHARVKAMMAVWGMHLDFAPSVAGGAVFPYLESMAAQHFGMRIGRGGADTAVRAMTGLLQERSSSARPSRRPGWPRTTRWRRTCSWAACRPSGPRARSPATGSAPTRWGATCSRASIHGARVAAIVAVVAGVLTCLLGSAPGLAAGYRGGWVDAAVSRVVEVWMAFPPVLFAILRVAVIGTGVASVVVAIVVIDWTRFARVVRAEAMAQSRMYYMEAARVAGMTRWRTLTREVLPNVAPVIAAVLTLEMGVAVVVEAILSFVGLSVSTDAPTWGGMIAEGRVAIHQAWWVLAFPMVALFLTGLALTQFGEALRERLDPVLR